MENTDPQHIESGATPKPIETDYEQHSNDPGPSRTAVEETGVNGAGSVLKWIIPAAVLLGLIVWFAMRK